MDTLPLPSSENNPYTIYALIDHRDYAIRYIGLTKNAYKRFADHLRRDGSNPAKDDWILELIRENVVLIMRTLEVVETIDQARNRETHWIQFYRFLGCSLLNQAIPSIHIHPEPPIVRPVKVRSVAPMPVTPPDMSTGPSAGRKYNNEDIRKIVVYAYQHKRWPDGMSVDMQQHYNFYYFTRPKKKEASDPQKYARHQRAWARTLKWVNDYEESKK